MYRYPSGPKAIWPPLWFEKGWGTSSNTRSLPGSALRPSVLTENRETTERLGPEAE